MPFLQKSRTPFFSPQQRRVVFDIFWFLSIFSAFFFLGFPKDSETKRLTYMRCGKAVESVEAKSLLGSQGSRSTPSSFFFAAGRLQRFAS